MRRAFIVVSLLVGSLWLRAGVEAGSVEAHALQTRLDAVQAGCPADVGQRLAQEAQDWLQRCQGVPNPLACEHVLLGEFEASPGSCQRVLDRLIARRQAIWR